MKKSFRQFIVEDEFDKKFEKFVTDCSIYFENCPDSFYDVLWRGDKKILEPIDLFVALNRNIPPPEFQKYNRTEIKQSGRTPKDVPNIVHDISNEIFIQKLGYPFRDGIMAVGSRTEAKSYAGLGKSPQVFVPANGFTLCYSPNIADFFNDLVSVTNLETDYDKKDSDDIKEILSNAMGEAQYVEGVRHLSSAINSNNEVMFYPKDGQTLRYYLFSENFWYDEMIPKLKKTFHK